MKFSIIIFLSIMLLATKTFQNNVKKIHLSLEKNKRSKNVKTSSKMIQRWK
jgi:hypothetical protein